MSSLRVELDERFRSTNGLQCAVGDTITGNVIVVARRNAELGRVFIRLEGKERVRVRKSKSARFSSDKHFFEAELDLHDFNSVRTDGEFFFPFALTLDGDIPGSASCSDWDGEGSITYKLKARVCVLHIFCEDLKFSEPIEVLEVPHFNNNLEISVSADVGFLCCSSGFLEISARTLNGSAFMPGERVDLEITIENPGGEPIEFLTVELVEEVQLNSSSSPDARESFWGVGVVVKKNLGILCTLPVSQAKKWTPIPVSFDLPEDIEPQAIGYKMIRYFYVLVRAGVSWSSDVKGKLPIQIVDARKVVEIPEMASPGKKGHLMQFLEHNFRGFHVLHTDAYYGS